jgi:hypothetical protein
MPTVNDIAAVVRNHPHNADPLVLALAIEPLFEGHDGCGVCVDLIAATVRRVDPNRTMGAGTLAEAIHADLIGDEGDN